MWCLVLCLFLSSLKSKSPGQSCKIQNTKSFGIISTVPQGYKDVVIKALEKIGFSHDEVTPLNYHAKYEQDFLWGQCSWLKDNWFLRTLEDRQRCSNFPLIFQIVWKTHIQWHIHNNKINHPDIFPFWPVGFNIEHENEKKQLEKLYIQHEKTPEPREPLVYIVKNPFKNAGAGIHLISSLQDFKDLDKKGNPMYPVSETKPLAQLYIHNPLLISGHKTTFRVWVLITSFDPLTIYRFSNGPVKFGGKKYKMDDFNDHDKHVASWTGKSDEKDSVGELEKKLSLIGGRTDFKTVIPILRDENGFNMTKVNIEIDEAILGTIFSAQPQIFPTFMRLLVNGRKHRRRDFELVGFDILLDEFGKPYVLEVNLLPDIRSDTPLITEAVEKMLSDLFEVVDLQDKYIDEVREITERKWKVFARLPSYENFRLNFSLQEIMNKDELFTFVNDEYELKRSQRTDWRRLSPLDSPSSEKYLVLSSNPRDQLFHQWYQNKLSIDRIPEKEGVFDLLKRKHNDKGELLNYVD